MKRSQLSFLIMACLALVLSTTVMARAATNVAISLSNNTGAGIAKLYFAPASTADWSEDDEMLKGQAFGDGTTLNITGSLKQDAGQWDMKIVWADGSSVEYEGVDFGAIAKASITYDKASNKVHLSAQ